MAFDLDSLKTDPKKVTDGAEVPYRGGSKLIVAKYNNKDAENFRMTETLKNSELFSKVADQEATPEELEEAERISFEIENNALAKHILKGWKGIKRAGEPLEYTSELGLDLLSDSENADFREDLVRISRNSGHYRPEEKAKATVKKAAASS
jgi:hypothetical protein